MTFGRIIEIAERARANSINITQKNTTYYWHIIDILFQISNEKQLDYYECSGPTTDRNINSRVRTRIMFSNWCNCWQIADVQLLSSQYHMLPIPCRSAQNRSEDSYIMPIDYFSVQTIRMHLAIYLDDLLLIIYVQK